MLPGEPLCRIWLGMNRYWDMICDGIKLRTCCIFTIWGSRADLSGIDTDVFPVRMTQLGLWSLHRISINRTSQMQSSHYQVRGHWYFHICFTVFFCKTHRLGTHSGFGLSSRSIQVGSSPLTSAGSASLALVPAPAAQSPPDNGSRNDVHSWCLYHRCRSHCSGGCCIDWRSCERCRRESCWEEGEELRKNSRSCSQLVGGLEHVLFFPYLGNFIIPTDEVIFLRGVAIPPTSQKKSTIKIHWVPPKKHHQNTIPVWHLWG